MFSAIEGLSKTPKRNKKTEKKPKRFVKLNINLWLPLNTFVPHKYNHEKLQNHTDKNILNFVYGDLNIF